jgi:hypothetical protein
MSNEPKPGSVLMPKSKLRAEIDQAAEIQRAMAEQLRALETHAAGQPVAKPGAWRHDTGRWPDTT